MADTSAKIKNNNYCKKEGRELGKCLKSPEIRNIFAKYQP